MEEGCQPHCNWGENLWFLDPPLYLDGRRCKAFPVLQTLFQGNQSTHFKHWITEDVWDGKKGETPSWNAISFKMMSWKCCLLLLGGHKQLSIIQIMRQEFVDDLPILQKCLLNWWKKQWAVRKEKKLSLSWEDRYWRIQPCFSCPGQGTWAWLRERSQVCGRGDRRAVLANSSHPAYEPQAWTLFAVVDNTGLSPQNLLIACEEVEVGVQESYRPKREFPNELWHL